MNDSRNTRSTGKTRKNQTNSEHQPRQRRRRYDLKFKLGAIKLITEQGYTAGEAARRLGIDRTNLKNWLHQLAPDFDPSVIAEALNSDDPIQLRKQLHQQRKEIERLRMERDILKKATAYFAKEQL